MISRSTRRGASLGAVTLFASSMLACTLLTSLDGLTGGSGEEAGVADGAAPVPSTPIGDPATVTPLGADAARAASDEAGPTFAQDGGAGSNDALSNGAGDDAAADANPCGDGGILCDGGCVDPTSDPSNCNGCGNVCATGVCGTTIAASMASQPQGWTFNGSASYDSFAPSAELTQPAVMYQSGTFLYGDPVVIDALTAQFKFRIGLDGGSRADGMGFVIEQTGPTAVGTLGGGLGMAGLTGYGVELDIFDNGLCADSSDDHVGVDDLASCPQHVGIPTSLFETDVSSVLDLADTHWHTAIVSLAAGAVSLTIDGTSLIESVPLPGLSDADGGYYLGFSGATGGLLADDGGPGGYRQEVKDIVITFPTPRCL